MQCGEDGVISWRKIDGCHDGGGRDVWWIWWETRMEEVMRCMRGWGRSSRTEE